MMGGSLHEWFSMVFYGFLLRRNKDVRRNREFEIQGSDNYFFEMIKINMRHKMLLNGLLRPGGNHKYMSWAFGFWMCSILEPCEFFSQTSDSMIFSLHFVQVGTKDVEHFFRFKVYIFFFQKHGEILACKCWSYCFCIRFSKCQHWFNSFPTTSSIPKYSRCSRVLFSQVQQSPTSGEYFSGSVRDSREICVFSRLGLGRADGWFVFFSFCGGFWIRTFCGKKMRRQKKMK